MATIIVGGVTDSYLDRYFMTRLNSAVQATVNEETHVCGFCENYSHYEDRDDYGECDFDDHALGFDCSIGRSCKSFKRSRKVEFVLKVVE